MENKNIQILVVSDLEVRYGAVPALKGVSIAVGKREIASIIGANGAGKSTLMKGIMNLVKKQSGKVEFKSLDISNLPPYKIPSLGVSYVPEGRQLFAKMSAKENLEMGAISLGRGKISFSDRMETVYELFPILKERHHQLAGTLSGGEQQMLAMGRALMSNPEACLFDEPSLGLAPLIQKEVFEVIQKLNISTLLVEQNAKKALEVSHRCYVLELGKIVLQGSSEVVSRDPQVEKAYLGG